MAVRQLKDGRWICYYRDGDRQRREYFGKGDLGEARARARDAQIRGERAAAKPGTGPTIEALLAEYHEMHLVEASTRITDWYRLDRVIIPALGSIYAEALTTDQLDRYVADRLNAGRTAGTVNRELNILKAAFAWAEARRPPLVIRNPLRGYRIRQQKQPRAQARANPISQEDFLRLTMHAPEHLLRAMLLLWYGGERPGRELLGILWQDVNWDHGEILVRSAHKGATPERYVPIHSGLAPYLRKWWENDVSVIGPGIETVPVVHYGGKRVKSLKTTWRSTKKRAGITKRLRLYDFRHAWFTNALRAGADLKSTSEIGGHSRADTTMLFYQHTVREQHREAVEKIPSIVVGPREVR